MRQLFFLGCVALAASGCHNEAADALQSGNVMGLIGLEGRWVGPVTPKLDSCGQTTRGQMSVERRAFAFDPFQGTTVINGTVSESGVLNGILLRPESGQQTISISFAGTVQLNDGRQVIIEGQLTSGHCTWAVNLKRG